MLHRSLAAAALATALAAPGLLAGDLTPPPGAPAPTMKTLDQVEPRIPVNSTSTPGDATAVHTIVAPGSYYLTGAVQAVSGKHGVRISASDVTLDLMGYSLRGAPGALGGIVVDFTTIDCEHITIRNGVVAGWGGSGVSYLADEDQPFTASGLVVESIQASDNGAAGIVLLPYSIARDCVVVRNASVGIAAGIGLVEGCLVAENGSFGATGSFGAVFRDCVARANTTAGFAISFGSSLTNCSSVSNTGIGVLASSDCIVDGCVVNYNTGDGISADTTRVLNCQVSFNGADGVELNNECQVIGNTVYRNNDGAPDGAGIHAAGFYNRIEGNFVIGSDRGVDVDQSSNVIIRNTARNNTINYAIVAFNKIGPIVSSPNSAAVSGSTGGAGMGSTDPTANFAY